MKAQSKNRKHPTCSRCRFHGKKDIRVLQHQCPFKNCPCSSCLLIKRRSIIYRAQKNLDKHDDNSDDQRSSPSMSSPVPYPSNVRLLEGNASTSSSGCIDNPHIPLPIHSRTDVVPNGPNQWVPSTTNTQHFKHSEYPKISDFQTLCVTFPHYSPSYLQSLFEQCGNDFQRTIDKILMNQMVSNGSCGNSTNSINGYAMTAEETPQAYTGSYGDWNSQRIVPPNGCRDQEYYDVAYGPRVPQNASWRYPANGGGSNHTQNYAHVDSWTGNEYSSVNCDESGMNWGNCYVNSFFNHEPSMNVACNAEENGIRPNFETTEHQISDGLGTCVGSMSGSELESSQQSVNSYSSSLSDDTQEPFGGNGKVTE